MMADVVKEANLDRIVVPEDYEVLDRWHFLRNLRQTTERILESNHETLSEITLPVQTGSSEKDAPMEDAPALRSSKEKAASVVYRKRRLARYEQVKKLHEQGMSMMAICRTLGMSRGVVRRYVPAHAFPEYRKRPPQKSMLDPFNRTFTSDGKRMLAPPCTCGGR